MRHRCHDRANSCDLIAIAEWLKSCGVTTVAMEFSDLTGQRIIAAILNGERDRRVLAALRDPKCKNDVATIGRALEET